MLNVDQHWEELRKSVELMMQEPAEKENIETNFPYQLSLLSITMLEFDRARFYLEKFKTKFLTSWSSVKDFSDANTKREVVSDLLRQQELQDFINSTKYYHLNDFEAKEDLSHFLNKMGFWVKKEHFSPLVSLGYLSDIYNSRRLYMDIMKMRYEEQYPEALYQNQIIRVSLNFSKGLIYLGCLDSAERILLESYQRKKEYFEEDRNYDYEFARLIVEIKLKGVKRDIDFITNIMDDSKLTYKFLEKKYLKIKQSIDFWGYEENDKNFLMLRVKAEKDKIECFTQYMSSDLNRGATFEVEAAEELLKNFESECLSSEANAMSFVNKMIPEAAARPQDTRTEALEASVELAEAMVRWYKENGKFEKKISEDQLYLVKSLIEWSGELLHISITTPKVPILLIMDLVSQLGEQLNSSFEKCFFPLPTWIFIRWIPQLISYANCANNKPFLQIISNLAQSYPEPTFYSLSVTLDGSGTPELAELFEQRFAALETHKSFVEALTNMVHPEQRLKYWLDELCTNLDSSAKTEEIKEILKKFLYKNNSLLRETGDFVRKFTKEISPYIKKHFGREFSQLTRMTPKMILQACKTVNAKAETLARIKSFQHYEVTYTTKLSQFSNWLSSYDINNNWRDLLKLELPGQYHGLSEPILSLHTKIAYFLPEILVIQSIRKPKRLSVFGTDEKVYHLLIKGGEDLRLDERIEQIFSIMNGVFDKDNQCSKRDFKISTFKVVPIKKNLGVMEWVKSTISIKSLIEKEMPPKQNIIENFAYIKRMGYLKKIGRGLDIRSQHIKLLSQPRSSIISDFGVQLKKFKPDLMKKALKRKVANAEHFIKQRKQFLRNYAIVSLASYILSIGDRHLDNFLFNTENGEIVAIDFGYSFGMGLGLSIPELMPFRLTQNFVHLSFPLSLDGLFRNSMVLAMRALKEVRFLVIDACEVFVRDPLIDWVKIARAKELSSVPDKKRIIDEKKEMMEEEPFRSQNMSEVGLDWYPKQKIEIVKDKLKGSSPVAIMIKELQSTRHQNENYFENVKKVVKGHLSRKRSQMGMGHLSLCDQTDALIDMATDPDVLGRAWTGWSPYV